MTRTEIHYVGIPVRAVRVMPDLNTRQRCVLGLLWLAQSQDVKLIESYIYKMLPPHVAGNDQHVRRTLRQLEKRGLAKADKRMHGFPCGNCNYKWSAV